MIAEEIDQRADGDEAVLGGKPLRRRQRLRPLGIAGPFLEKKGHRVFICGKEIQDRAHAEAMSQLFESIFVSGQCTTIHKDVVSGILTLYDDVHGRSHASSVLQAL